MFLLQGLSYEIMDRNEELEYTFPDVNELYETFEKALEKFNILSKQSPSSARRG